MTAVRGTASIPKRRSSWRLPRVLPMVRTEWQGLGGLGRIALLGVVLSAALAIVLGFTIPSAAERHLLKARTETLAAITDDLAARGLVPTGDSSPDVYASFHDAVQLRLIGGGTVRVKVWSPDGEVLYSDARPLVGRRFPLGEGAQKAFDGQATSRESDLSDPENELEAGLGPLLEFYLPVRGGDGEVFGVFEVYERADSFNDALARIRRNVWLSIGTGLGVLGIFMASLTVTHARAINQRRRQAERLLRELVTAQDEERRRVVGLMHDDVGQPLYRLLYGLRGCSARVGEINPEAGAELARLEGVTEEIERRLRTGLGTLRAGVLEDLALAPALEHLATVTRRESDLEITVDAPEDDDLSQLERSVLIRAAQEALLNVHRHARATTVMIRAFEADGRWAVEVEDDGAGVHGPEGLGLVTCRERLETLGGDLALEPRRGGGTMFRVWIPAAREERS